MVCVICAETLPARKQKYCSVGCYAVAHRERARVRAYHVYQTMEREPQRYEKQCIQCGVDFIVFGKCNKQMHCSSQCKIQRHRERRRRYMADWRAGEYSR